MIIVNLIKFILVYISVSFMLKLNINKKSLIKKTYNKIYTFSENQINKQYFLKNISSNIDYFNSTNTLFHINKKNLFFLEIIFISFGIILLILKTKIIFSSIIIIIFMGSIPIQYIYYKNNLFKNNFLKNLDNLIITLKNNVKNNNDIIYAIKKANKNKILKIYFEEFINAINNGVGVLEAFEYIKSIHNIKEFSNIVTIFQSSYIYGGNYYNILEKIEKQLKNCNKMKYDFKQKNTEMISTLVIMLVINIYIIISYILSNREYVNLFLNTFIGKIIIDINVILFIYIYFIIIKINNMEEINGA